MSEPAWKKLVEQLKSDGFKSPYLERLRARLPAAHGSMDLAREILQEMAAALGRAEDKVNLALLELDVQGKALDAIPMDGPGAAGRAAKVAAFNEKRKAAAQALWELRVHREALGFRRNDDLSALYPIPPRRE